MPRPPPANKKKPPACHDHGDCHSSACCDHGTGQCISRLHPNANHEAGCNLLRMKGRYPDRWAVKPGEVGFSNYVRGLLVQAQLPRTLTCNHTDPKDNWYQTVLSYLVHPRSPIHRLLVCWQLGTGKTIGMLRVLDNYFDDPRPKILVFPTRALVANFYEELARRPNRYRQWAIDLPAQWRWPTTGLTAEAQSVDALKKLLEYGTTKSALAGPLRAFSYTQVGGQTLIKYTDTTRQRTITARSGHTESGRPTPDHGSHSWTSWR